ncbi:MAG: AbrB/MazE/SpoVT family DNA-binding domain-containing protein [Thermoplasmata archaeon]
MSVVIPAALAKSMDWGPGTQVQIEPVGPDMLTLRRARASAAPT